jgi:dihydrofolate reductase
MKHFKAIAAMSLNRVIGAGNKIPWHLPEDFKWFKKMTSGQVVVMGRTTFESLPKPLPNRKTLILTRTPRRLIRTRPDVFGMYKEWRGGRHLKQAYQLQFGGLSGERPDDIRVFGALHLIRPREFANEVFICGGSHLYEQALPLCSDLYLTLVNREVEGDTFFPKFEDDFELVEEVQSNPEFRILHYRNQRLAK